MSNPIREAELSEAQAQYETEVNVLRFSKGHTGAGECTSGCNNDFDCPMNEIGTFQEWLEDNK